MKLLICTQAVDTNDSVLGFFVRWIEEFAKNCERVEVICLREGAHSLPENVKVHPLRSRNKIGRAVEIWRHSTRLSYERVLVHMNPEYFVAAGLLWKLLGKKASLWYTHKSVDFKLRIAEFFADVIFTASKESFRLRSSKVQVMGHGIDTDFFSPDQSVVRGEWWLSAGRLTQSKRHDLAIKQAMEAGKTLLISGEGPERAHLEHYAHTLGAQVQFLGGLSQRQLRDEYRRAARFIHTSETGSLDKVVLEALACGLPVKTDNQELKFLERESAEYVQKHHSLAALIPRIIKLLS